VRGSRRYSSIARRSSRSGAAPTGRGPRSPGSGRSRGTTTPHRCAAPRGCGGARSGHEGARSPSGRRRPRRRRARAPERGPGGSGATSGPAPPARPRAVHPEDPAGRPGAPVHGVGLEPERTAELREPFHRRHLALDDEAGREPGIALQGRHQIRLAECHLEHRRVEERNQGPELVQRRPEPRRNDSDGTMARMPRARTVSRTQGKELRRGRRRVDARSGRGASGARAPRRTRRRRAPGNRRRPASG
jgi:hypothetical protein